MVSLLDIAEIKFTAKIRGKDVEVRGILAEHLAALFHQYPDIRKVITGNADNDVIGSLINQFPMVVADFIAIGCGAEPGAPDYDKHVAVARKLAIGEQWDILSKIAEATFPKGPKSFLDGVAAAVGLPPDALSWDQVMKSPQPSLDVSQQDAANANVGEAHPANSQAG